MEKMTGMKLVFPSISYKEKAADFIEEFYKSGSDINGGGYVLVKCPYTEDWSFEKSAMWLRRFQATSI